MNKKTKPLITFSAIGVVIFSVALSLYVVRVKYIELQELITTSTTKIEESVSTSTTKIEESVSKLQGAMVSRIEELQGLTLAVSSLEPPIHIHSYARLYFIQSFASQLPTGGIVILGDSITEGARIERICGLPVLNAGIGGTGVMYFNNNAKDFLTIARPNIVVIALGINDARFILKGKKEERLRQWKHQYSKLVQQVQNIGSVPVLTTILPVERHKPLGDTYFSIEIIDEFNSVILRMAREDGFLVIDLYDAFAEDNGYMPQGATVDGVHLSAQSYGKWIDSITKGVVKALQSKGLECDPQ
jgi:lysophospholipase L1-like esterase